MKTKHVIINILPLFVWVTYYCMTMQKNGLFLVGLDEWIALAVFVFFTTYNLFSKGTKEFVLRNLILTTSWVCGIYISGQVYIKFCPHMSDEHYAVWSITGDHVIYGIIITGIACLIRFIINKARKKKG